MIISQYSWNIVNARLPRGRVDVPLLVHSAKQGGRNKPQTYLNSLYFNGILCNMSASAIIRTIVLFESKRYKLISIIPH